MITALLVALSLIGLFLATVGMVRFEQVRRLREERTRWEDLALLLGAELRVAEDGSLSLHGQRGDVVWVLRTLDPRFERPALEASFDAADRLAPATVWREPPEEAGELERLGSDEFRTVFEVEQGAVAAGCVRWVDDREIQDLLLATGAFAATVAAQDPRRPVIRVVLEDAQLDAVRLAIEWTARMRTLAREGVSATPGH